MSRIVHMLHMVVNHAPIKAAIFTDFACGDTCCIFILYRRYVGLPITTIGQTVKFVIRTVKIDASCTAVIEYHFDYRNECMHGCR